MKERKIYHAARKAETDLIDIWMYVAEQNVDAADRLIDAIGEVCNLLAREPLLGEVFDRTRPSLRRFSHDNYVIYYLTTMPITVVRVLHGARDAGELV
jgi:toxin ParE1/3/4